MAVVTVSEARADFSRLIRRAIEGEEVLITRRGKPVVRLASVQVEPVRRPLGLLAGYMELPHDGAFFDPLPDDILDAFYDGPVFPQADKTDEEPR